MEALDIKGCTLNVGDNIVYTSYRDSTLYKGTVVRITEYRTYIQPNMYYKCIFIKNENTDSRIVKLK